MPQLSASSQARLANVWPLQSDLKAMHALYGNPDANGDGAPDPSWVAKYLTTIVPPFAMFYGPTRIKRITVNRGCSAALLEALGAILDHYGSENNIRDVGLHNYSGCFNFRPKRAGKSLSMHAYACAVDFDAGNNKFQSRKFKMPAEVSAIFRAQGAAVGVDWDPPDAMHIQYSRVR